MLKTTVLGEKVMKDTKGGTFWTCCFDGPNPGCYCTNPVLDSSSASYSNWIDDWGFMYSMPDPQQ